MGHLGEGTQITTIQDKEIVLTASNGQHFKMKITDLAEAVRQVMQVATSEKNGLLSKAMFSIFDSGLTPFKGMSNTTDINQLFKECDAGLSMFSLISAAINSPGTGFLLHFQRLSRANLTAGSQLIYQISLLINGNMRYRYGIPTGTEMSYSNWIDL